MAMNFKIFVHRNCENVHLKLTGDFDGSSAYELLDVMRRNSFRASRVFIHTESLKQIEPFGREVFRNNLNAVKTTSLRLLFTGNNARQLAPEESQICSV
jgi:hypothetical protein